MPCGFKDKNANTMKKTKLITTPMRSLKLTIIFPYHSCIIPQNDTYTKPPQVTNQKETHHVQITL